MNNSETCPICYQSNYSTDLKHENYKIVRCNICDMAYSIPHIAKIEIYEDSYNKKCNSYESYPTSSEVIENNEYLTWAQKQLKKLLVKKNGKLLDIGCSTGMFLSAFKKLGFDIWGLEPSRTAVESTPYSLRKKIEVGTLSFETYNNSFFDIVTAWEVIEHLENPGEFLEIINSILKKDGLIALSCPNWNSPWEKKTLDVNRRPPYHLNYFTEVTLPKLLVNKGYKIVSIKCKPIPWSEELGRLKWLHLPISLLQSYLFRIKSNRLFVLAQKNKS